MNSFLTNKKPIPERKSGNLFRADLHIHSVLSPCGDLEMSPANIIREALEKNLDIIGITDHNATHHGPLLRKLGSENNILVLTGAEVTTREEVHCLTFFENDTMLALFQKYLDIHLPFIQNKPSLFGFQVVVDENENIMKEIQPLLITGLDQPIEAIEKKVHELGGLFIPAHVNKKVNSLLGNLGFVPDNLDADAMEVTGPIPEFLASHPGFSEYTLLRNSDAHHPGTIGSHYNLFEMERPHFNEIRMALHHEKNRRVIQA